MNVRVSRALVALSLSTLAACASSTGGASTSTAPAPAVAGPPKPFEYAAGTGQYRYTSDGKSTQSVGGQARETGTITSRVMTIAVARSAPDTLTMTLTIDSMTTTNTMGTPTLGIEKMPGTKFAAKLAPNGSFYSVTGPSQTENPLGFGMTDEAGRVLPRLKAILTMGATWTDTVSETVKQQTIDLKREIVTKFNVAGDTTVAGVTGWKITRESAFKATGTGVTNGQNVTVDMTGTSKGNLVVSKAGVLLGGRSEEIANGTATVPAFGLQIGLNTASTAQFTKVK